MKTDETGLHAEDCDCQRCEIGLGPSPLERAAALRALAARRMAAAARAAEAARAIKRAVSTREPPRRSFGPSRPYTEEQQAELVRLRAEFKLGRKVSDADDVDE